MQQKLFPVLVLLLVLFLDNSCSQSDHPAWTTPELNTSDIVLQIGQTAVRQGVSKIPGKALEYSSSNPSVATVDQNGLITALNVGETTITVNMPYPEHPNHITSASFLVKVVAIPANQLKDLDKATPLTLVADEDGFIIVTFNNGIVLANDIHYSINGGAEQTIAKNTEGEYKIAVSKGDFVQFWSTNTALGGGGGGGATSRALTRAVDSGAKYINIRPSMKTEIYGNVMSLLKGKDNLESATTIEANNAFYGLFAGADKLVNNTDRLLVLPATTLTEGCYQDMFNGCKGIEKAPELPAPKLEKNCYQEMFYDCAKLNHVKCLATDISAENSTKDWLGKAGTEATGPKVLESAVPMTPNSDDGVPTAWTAAIVVESVTLSSSELALVIGEGDVTLTATVKPDDATDKTVTWTSSNPAVATVTATTDNTQGTVHAVAEGEATITAQAGDKTATCKVTVTAKSAATVTTAPTATEVDILAGSSTVLVTEGKADGGTMMYAVTTTNTKPTATDVFSATVPTAADLAAGTYYVWYYVKADADHTDSAISSTGIAVTVKDAPGVNALESFEGGDDPLNPVVTD